MKRKLMEAISGGAFVFFVFLSPFLLAEQETYIPPSPIISPSIDLIQDDDIHVRIDNNFKKIDELMLSIENGIKKVNDIFLAIDLLIENKDENMVCQSLKQLEKGINGAFYEISKNKSIDENGVKVLEEKKRLLSDYQSAYQSQKKYLDQNKIVCQ